MNSNNKVRVYIPHLFSISQIHKMNNKTNKFKNMRCYIQKYFNKNLGNTKKIQIILRNDKPVYSAFITFNIVRNKDNNYGKLVDELIETGKIKLNHSDNNDKFWYIMLSNNNNNNNIVKYFNEAFNNLNELEILINQTRDMSIENQTIGKKRKFY